MAFSCLNKLFICVFFINAVLCSNPNQSDSTSDNISIHSSDKPSADLFMSNSTSEEDGMGDVNSEYFFEFSDVTNDSDNVSSVLNETQLGLENSVQSDSNADNGMNFGESNHADSSLYDSRQNFQIETTVDGSLFSSNERVPSDREYSKSQNSYAPNKSTTTPYSVEKPFGTEGKPLVNDINKTGHKAFRLNQPGHQIQPSNASENIHGDSTRPLKSSSSIPPQTFPKTWPEQTYTNKDIQQTNGSNTVASKLNVSPSVSSLYKNIVTQILYHVLDTVSDQGDHQLAEVNSGENVVSEVISRSDSLKSEPYRYSAFPEPILKLSTHPKYVKNQEQSPERGETSVVLNDGIPNARLRVASRSVDPSPKDGNIENAINDISGSSTGAGIGDGLALSVDQTVFNRFAAETLNFEKQSATEIARLDNLLRQLAVAAQSDFEGVSTGVSNLHQELTRTQQQLIQAWSIMNGTHAKDISQIGSELRDLKADVFRLHDLLTDSTPVSQSAPQGRAAEIREEAKVGTGVDCAALQKSGVNVSGVYDLQPDPSNNETQMTAFCDMETEGGGWTVFQRRQDGSDDFFRGWNSYKHGFGSFLHDHWLGLENIHFLTKYGDNVMRIEITDWENETRWAEFSYTRIMDESDGYRILVGGYHGTAGDPFHSLSYDMRMQSMRFSTFDSDNDLDSGGNCALTFTSGWWFNKCFQINLNGVWYSSSRYAGPSMNGIVWDLWHEHFNGYSLQRTEMKLRPAGFSQNRH